MKPSKIAATLLSATPSCNGNCMRADPGEQQFPFDFQEEIRHGKKERGNRRPSVPHPNPRRGTARRSGWGAPYGLTICPEPSVAGIGAPPFFKNRMLTHSPSVMQYAFRHRSPCAYEGLRE